MKFADFCIFYNFFVAVKIMVLVIAIAIALIIVQLYVLSVFDSSLKSLGYPELAWTPAAIIKTLPAATAPVVETDEAPPAGVPALPVGSIDLYTLPNLAGTRTRAANNDLYIFCSQRGGVRTWNFESIVATSGQPICVFSRSPTDQSESMRRFFIYTHTIRNFETLISQYPDISTSNTGIQLIGWEHMDLDFLVMPCTADDYHRLVDDRLTACKKLCAAWQYSDDQTSQYCQFQDPFS